MQFETGKKFLATYKAPIAVVGIIMAAVGLDYAFRASAKDYYTQGLNEMQVGKYDNAISHFSRALRQNPADPASRFGLGWAYHSKGWIDEALKQYEQAAKGAMDTAHLTLFNTGVILQQKRKLDEAAAVYNKVILLNPNSHGALLNLGYIYADQGKNEAALQLFTRVAQLEPTNANAFLMAGTTAERLGRRDEAKKHYKTALEKNPNLQNARERLNALGG